MVLQLLYPCNKTRVGFNHSQQLINAESLIGRKLVPISRPVFTNPVHLDDKRAFQVDTRRAAVLFEPGTHTGIESDVGFYESITGLGETPSAVNLSQSFLESNELINGNDTHTFWRSMENLEMTTPGSATLQWGVSQGTSLRRMLINNPVELTDSGCNFSSGGFIADSQII
jgi:hypothetical protein